MESSDEEKFSPENVTGGSEKEKSTSSLSDTMKELWVNKDHHDTDSNSDSDFSDSEYLCSVCNKKFSGFIPFHQHEKGSKHAKAVLKKKREKKLLEKITAAEKEIENEEEHLSFIKEPYAVCKPCGKQFGAPESYALHMDSKAHKQKALQASLLDQVRKNGEINVDMLKELYKSKIEASGDADDLLEDTRKRFAPFKEKDENEESDVEEFECKDCKKIFSGLIPYTQHVLSKVHAKVIERKKLLQKIAPEDYATKSKIRDLSHLVIEDDILVCALCSTSFTGPENAMQHLKSKIHSKNLEKYLIKQERKQQKTASKVTKLAEKSSENNSYPESDDPLKATASTKLKNDSLKTTPAKLQESSGNDGQQKSESPSKHRDDSPISVSSKRKFHTLSRSSDSLSDNDNQQKVSATKNKEDSSSNQDTPPTVANPPKEMVDNENKMVGLGQRPTFSSTPDEPEGPIASDKVQETFVSYEKYKKYKEIINSVLKDDTDA